MTNFDNDSDMIYSKELERDVTTTAMTKAILCLKNFGIYSFIEHDLSDFSRRLGAVMYMPCVNALVLS